MIPKRLERLRQEMKKRGIAAYVIPSDDCHGSEYVCGHFRAREWITGFTGSAGTAVVTMDEAGLWTDGRYFIQAARQLQGSDVTLFRSGEPGVPTIEEFLAQRLRAGERLGFDGRVMAAHSAMSLKRTAEKQNATLAVKEDLIGAIWEDRPDIPDAPVWILEERYAGERAADKIRWLREKMAACGADVHVLSSLDDSAWLLNLRGGDIPCVPVTLSFLLLGRDFCRWYVRDGILDGRVRSYLKDNQIEVVDYNGIYRDLEHLELGKAVLLDERKVNYRLLQSIPEGARVVNAPNPTEKRKAVKNPVEIWNLREAHLKEGVAFTRFMYWLKTHVGREPMTERSAAEKLQQLRMEQEHCLGYSFEPICAYGPNGAIVHYTATEETDADILPEGFLLVDAGGHYLEGTTDTTRTFALGPLSGEQKRMFTAVCRGNLALANARFLHGCTGYSLDVLCREPLWRLGMDYKHGTGHGVGYLLNVHEGPNAFRWKLPEEGSPAVLEAGMVTTDEPGIYIEGKYGIRTENELLCVEGEANGYGQFLEFETLTLTPIDLDAILPEELGGQERGWLNAYHERVYLKIAPHLPPEEREWLKQYTRAI